MMVRTHARWMWLCFAVSVGGCGASDDAATVDTSSETGNDTASLAEDILLDPPQTDVSEADIVHQDGTSIDTVTPDAGEVQGSDMIAEDVEIVDVGVDVFTEDVTESGSIILPEGLIGTPVPTPSLPPEFIAVVDSDGNEVTAADLLGSPTIMWFFPIPSTPG